MFFTENKLEGRMNELCEYRYRDKVSLEEFHVKEEEQNPVNPAVPGSFEGFEIIRTGDNWKGRDTYLWMHKTVQIPDGMKGKRALGIFDFGRTGAGNNSGFESMLYIDGVPYQGVDSNHKEVFFKEEMQGRELNLTFRLWSGLEGGGMPVPQEHKISRADLAWLDEKTDHLYYMGSMIVDALKRLSGEDPVRYDLMNALDEACLCIDWAVPGSAGFYESVYKAHDILMERIGGMPKGTDISVSCVGHTHIDVAWLWRLKHTREKISRSFSTVLRLMEEYPDYIFLQTQPQLYEYIKTDFPEIYDKIKEKVAQGQWEVDGAMWVEADCNLTSGESLTRQILIGAKFIQDEFGKDIHYLWLPDVFGYSWALPQIMKKSGIDTFMTTKISWNQYNRMPHDTFYWKGMDGSEVLTHFITTPEPGAEPGSWFYTYNGKLTPETVQGSWKAYSEKAWNKDLLICYGYGDGGGGVNRDMLEQRRCIDELPGLPALKNSTAKEYFEKLHENAEKTRNYIHTWDGELYLEYHRGTYTSHAHNKRMNRKMEQKYREAEWMTVMKALSQRGDNPGNVLAAADQEKLTIGWKHILTEQFHDIIPGSSILEVYEDSKKDYVFIENIANQVEQEFFDACLQGTHDSYTIFNTAAFERKGMVCVPGVREGSFRDEKGNRLITQYTGTETLVETSGIPSMGVMPLTFEAGETSQWEIPFRITDKKAETPYYQVVFNEYGQITRLFDKEFQREVLPTGSRANVLEMFEDKPMGNDAWDIDIFYQEKMREVIELKEFRVSECGSLRMTIHMEWKYMSSWISQDAVFYASDRRIDFKTSVDYHEKHQLLKASFPVDIRTTYATYDVQYGNVRRPNHWNTSWDQARFETVAHRFVDLSEHGYGVSLLNDCKYGHDVKDNVLRITLVKAATHPDYLQDQGQHVFTYALLPHGGDFVEGKTVQEAVCLNEELVCVPGKADLGYESFLSFDSQAVELDAIKKSEDGNYMVIRFHEYTGGRQNVGVKTGFAFAAWMEGDLRERPLEEERRGEEIRLTLKPYEIKTILIKLN